MRTLAIRPGAIGDVIVSLPALESLRSGQLEVWVASAIAPLIRFAGSVRAIAGSGLDFLGLPEREPPASILERLRRFDRIVSWYGANRPEFQAAVRELGLPFEFLTALPRGEGGVHAVDFYCAQLGLPAGAIPRLDCPRRDGGFAVIHPFSGSPGKNWPLEHFRAIARCLEKEMPVYWCAGPHEALDGAVRFDDLWELACWLAQARVYVGNDSGISHLAAAAGAPVVALFGPTDPNVWAPRGDVRVVRMAEAGVVWNAVRERLSRRDPQNPLSVRLPER